MLSATEYVRSRSACHDTTGSSLPRVFARLRLSSSSVRETHLRSYLTVLTYPPRPTVYASYLVFQLFSHKTLYDDGHPDVFKSTPYVAREKRKQDAADAANAEAASQAEANGSSIPLTSVTAQRYQGSPTGSVSQDHDPEAGTTAAHSTVEEEETEQPQMSVLMTIGLLAVVTVVSLLTAVYAGGYPPDPSRMP